jgi:Nuclease-related domain
MWSEGHPGERLVLALASPPSRETSWKRGADGERRTAERLELLLADSDVVLLRDRRIAGTRTSIDHLAIGPGGVTVIDSKLLSGRVEVRGAGAGARLMVAGRDRSRMLDGIAARLAAVGRVMPQIDLRGALCFPRVDGLPLIRRLEPRGVLVDGPKRVARLARRAGPIAAEERELIAARLADAFPPHRGG